MSEFEKKVRIALIERNMNLTSLAEALEMSLSYLSDLLKGKRNNQVQLDKIKDYLNLTDETI